MTARGSAARSPALPGERAGHLTPGVPHQRPWKSRGGWALGPTSQSRTQPLVAPDLSLGSSSITNTSQGHSWSLMLGSLDVDTGLGACPGLPGVKAAGEKGTVPCCWALGTRVPSQAWSSGDSSPGLRPDPESRVPENARQPHAHLPLYAPRWWAGEWQLCSSSCGPGGLSRRAVLCIRSVGLDEQRALEPPACEHLPQPPAETPCNRDVPCPATWAVGNWSEVSISTGGVSSAIGLGLQGGRDSVPGTPTAGHHGGRGTGTSQVWPIPKPQRLGCPGTSQPRSPAARALSADTEQLAGYLARPWLLLA